MIRVCLVGGVRLTREALAALIGRDQRLEVVIGMGSDDELRDVDGSADVFVVDGSSTGLQVIRRIVEETGVPIVVLASPADEAWVFALARMGVMGFIEKGACFEELLAAIRGAVRNEATFPPRIGTALLRHLSSPQSELPPDEIGALTLREREVIRLVAEGLSNKQIAARLCIELATVKNHVHNILSKLRVSDRAEAVTRLRMAAGIPGRWEI